MEAQPNPKDQLRAEGVWGQYAIVMDHDGRVDFWSPDMGEQLCLFDGQVLAALTDVKPLSELLRAVKTNPDLILF